MTLKVGDKVRRNRDLLGEFDPEHVYTVEGIYSGPHTHKQIISLKEFPKGRFFGEFFIKTEKVKRSSGFGEFIRRTS